MSKKVDKKRKPNMQDSTLRLHRALLKRVKALESRMSLMTKLKFSEPSSHKTLGDYFQKNGL